MRVLITPRQEEILQATVRKHIETGEPVGSDVLVERSRFSLSSATVRAEFVFLERSGLLFQPHASAGRVPTTAGYRYYVNHYLEQPRRRMRADDTEPFGELNARAVSSDAERIRRLAHTLADTSHTLAVVVEPASAMHEAGFGNLFESPELRDDPHGSEVDELLDMVLEHGLELSSYAEEGPAVFIDGENPFVETKRLSVVFTAPLLPSGAPLIAALIGPVRMPYDHHLRLMDALHHLIDRRG